MASSTGETTGRTMETKMGIIRAILMEILMDKIQEQWMVIITVTTQEILMAISMEGNWETITEIIMEII